MTNYLTNTSAKIKKTGQLNNIRLYEFNLPAVSACPFAGECKKYCYADKGRYLFSNVQNKYKTNYELTQDLSAFINTIQAEIDQKRVEAVRIHSSGDFYSLKYLKAWIKLANQNQHVLFYGYTKSIPFFRNVSIPNNFIFTFSTGGKKDNLIKATDRRAVIFKNKKDLESAGFVDCSKDDLLMTKTKKVGLIYH
jgi:hypothetical protein